MRYCTITPGTVHDAIACAAFLKFHPQLPKGGARVVTRPQPEAAPARPQRHSVEVTNAGELLSLLVYVCLDYPKQSLLTPCAKYVYHA